MSTYNKSLPKPSEICWMDSSRKTRETTIEMPFAGVIPAGVSYLGWRQSSYTYSYQVQYMVTARLTPSNQLATGTEKSKTSWKYPNPDWSGDVDTFNKCVKQDKENRYYRYYSFANKSLMTKGSYDELKVTVRVRSFNKSKKQHGPWVTKDLYIKCKPQVATQKIVALADGGLRIYLDTNGWMRGDSSVIIKDIRHASTKENKATLTEEVEAIGDEEMSSYPYVEFAGKNFNAGFSENDEITLKNCVFKTCDGVEVSLNGTYAIDSASAVIDKPILSITRNNDEATLMINVAKGDTADVWDTVESWMLYEDGGKTKRIEYVRTWEEDGTKSFEFMPPLDRDLTLVTRIENELGGVYEGTETWTTRKELEKIASDGRVMINYTTGEDEQPENGMFYGSELAVMNYEVEISTDASRPYEKELPFGRKRPIAFLGEGLEKSIDIKGNVDATENGQYKTAVHSESESWEELQENQGIVLARLPAGKMYHALCTKVAIDQTDEYDDSKDITISLEEVEI